MPVRSCFKAALAAAGTTQRDWAKANGFSQSMVSRFISGKTTSRRLAALADGFTTQQLATLAKESADAA